VLGHNTKKEINQEDRPMRNRLAPLCALPWALAVAVNTSQAQQPVPYIHPAGQPIPAVVHPYVKKGDVGRSTGMFDHYRPEFRPGGQHPGVTCQLVVIPKDHVIEPGSTEAITVICNEPLVFTDKDKAQGYTILEGSRLVGEASLVPPVAAPKP
jgi:hypothetical protein